MNARIGCGIAAVVLAIASLLAFSHFHLELLHAPQTFADAAASCFSAPHPRFAENALRMMRELIAFSAFALTTWAIGAPLQRQFLRELDTPERVLATFGLGMVTLHFVLFQLASLHQWSAWLFQAIAVAGLLSTLIALMRGRRRVVEACIDVVRYLRARWVLAIAIAFVALTALENLGPEVGADAGLYHVGVPTRWLLEHGFVSIDHHFLSNLPLPQSMFYGFLIALGPSDATRLLPPTMMLLALAALVRAASPFADTSKAPLEVWSLLAVPALTGYLAISGSDHLGIAFFALGLLFGLRGRLAIAFLFLGFAGATKYTTLVQVILACIYFVLRAPKPRRLLIPAVLFASTSFVWALKAIVFTHNPVYPFLERHLAPRIERNIAISGSLIHSFTDVFKFPAMISFSRGLMYLAGLHWPALIALALLAIYFRREDRRGASLVALMLALGWIAFAVLWENARYSGPLFTATALAASVAIARFEEHRMSIRAPLLAAMFASTFAAWAYRTELVRPATFVCGRYDAIEYVTEQSVPMAFAPPNEMFATINHKLDREKDRVLFIGETRVTGIEVPFVAGTELDRPIYDFYVTGARDRAGVRHRFQRHGITHIAINIKMAAYLEAHAYPVLVSGEGSTVWADFFSRSVRVIARKKEAGHDWVIVELLPVGEETVEPVHDFLADAALDSTSGDR